MSYIPVENTHTTPGLRPTPLVRRGGFFIASFSKEEWRAKRDEVVTLCLHGEPRTTFPLNREHKPHHFFPRLFKEAQKVTG